jgi:cysteine-rich repeat protein
MLRTLLLVLLSMFGCFDAALTDPANPTIACFDAEDCPPELSVCGERLKVCVGLEEPCIDRFGADVLNGSTCTDFSVCIDGACVLARCGDGYRSFDEPCDDGNDVSTDECLSCVVATCGDGFVQAGIEGCDSTPECGPDCQPLPCVDGFTQCNGPAIDICKGGVFERIANCAVLEASCINTETATFCINELNGSCFDGTLVAGCIDSVCNIDTAATGSCTTNACEGPRGACVGQNFQARCFGGASLIIDCASIDAACIEDVGCVSTTDQSCIATRTACDAGEGKFDPCPSDGICPAPFVDTDGNTRTSPRFVLLPSTTLFDITPARDEDCVQFGLAVTHSVKVSATIPSVNCVADGGDPAVEVVDSDGRSVLVVDDVTDRDFCAAAIVSLSPGTYRACAMEAKVDTRTALLNVTLGIEVVETTSVVLPFSTTVAAVSIEPTCFAFELSEPSRVTVDAGGDDRRCLDVASDDAIDTVASLEGQFVDDVTPLRLCGLLTTEDPLSAGTHVACVAAFAAPAGDVPVSIRVVE